MLNFVENLLENERGPMSDQDLTKTDYDPDTVRMKLTVTFYCLIYLLGFLTCFCSL
jgi:hypothetical protein